MVRLILLPSMYLAVGFLIYCAYKRNRARQTAEMKALSHFAKDHDGVFEMVLDEVNGGDEPQLRCEIDGLAFKFDHTCDANGYEAWYYSRVSATTAIKGAIDVYRRDLFDHVIKNPHLVDVEDAGEANESSYGEDFVVRAASKADFLGRWTDEIKELHLANSHLRVTLVGSELVVLGRFEGDFASDLEAIFTLATLVAKAYGLEKPV